MHHRLRGPNDHRVLKAAFALSAAGCASMAQAGGFYLADQSTVGLGRAYSGETAAQGAQQQFYNPAAIGGITGIENYMGFTAIVPTVNVRPDLSNPTTVGATPVTGASAHDPVRNGYLPNGGVAAAITNRLAVGFTMSSPYSFTSNYNSDFFGRYSADKSRIRTFDFQPSVAFMLTKHISIGAAANVEYLRATLSNYLPDPFSAILGTPYPDGHQYLKADGWDAGYSLGAQYHDRLFDLGIAYKSAIRHHLEGHLIIDGFTDPFNSLINTRVQGGKAAFDLPWQLSGSVRYHVTPQFTLDGQITRFGWSKFGTVDVTDLGSLPNQAINENFKNTFTYAVGADYAVNARTTVRAGVARDMSPIRKGYAAPDIPDGNRWLFGMGGSHEINQKVGFDIAGAYDHVASTRLDNTSVLFGGTIVQNTTTTGGYTQGAHALIFSVAVHMHL